MARHNRWFHSRSDSDNVCQDVQTVIGPLILKLFLGEIKEKMHEGTIKLF